MHAHTEAYRDENRLQAASLIKKVGQHGDHGESEQLEAQPEAFTGVASVLGALAAERLLGVARAELAVANVERAVDAALDDGRRFRVVLLVLEMVALVITGRDADGAGLDRKQQCGRGHRGRYSALGDLRHLLLVLLLRLGAILLHLDTLHTL